MNWGFQVRIGNDRKYIIQNFRSYRAAVRYKSEVLNNDWFKELLVDNKKIWITRISNMIRCEGCRELTEEGKVCLYCGTTVIPQAHG